MVRIEGTLRNCLRAQAPAAYALGVIWCPAGLSCCVQFYVLPADINVCPTGLVAVSSKSLLDLLAHGGTEHRGATECTNSLLALTRGEMARAGGAVFDFSIGRDAEPLLRAFVCFLLGHGRISEPSRSWRLGGIHQCSNLTAG